MVENEEKKALLQVVHVPVISADAAAVVVEIPHLPPEYTSIIGFKRSSFREIVFYALCMITGGILGLISKWYLPLRCHISRIPCSSFRDADYVLVKAPGGNMSEIEIKRIELPDNYMSLLNRGAKTRSARYFDFRKQRYLYKESQSSFQRLDTKLSKQFAQLHDMRHGVSSAEASFLIQFHGANSITIEVEPIYKMLMEKVFHVR